MSILACVTIPPARAQNVEPETTISASASDADDRAIDQRIERILDQMEGLQGVYVVVKSGVVTLYGQVAEVSQAEQAADLAGRVEGVVAVKNEITEVASVTERFVPAWERIRNRVRSIAAQLPLLGLAVLVFTVIAAAGMWIAARRWPWSRVAPNAFIADLLRKVVRLFFLALALFIALDIAGATALLGTILGAAGIVGLAVGFAVRDTVENYIASILLSVRQPFQPHDYVAIEGHEGNVIMLTSRATVLMDSNGNHIRIPNSTVFKAVVQNFTRNPERRFEFVLGLDPDANLRAAMDLGIKTILDQPFTLDDPGPEAWIDDVGDSSVRLRFTGWVNQAKTSFQQARSEAIRLVKLALEKEGFALPEPAFTVNVEGDPKGAARKTQPRRSAPAGKADQPETAAAADTSPDDTVGRKIEEERARSERADLLDDAAPQEMGS